MFPLLRRCIEASDDEAWADLFLFFEQAASPSVRCLLRRFGFCEREIECVLLEVFEELYVDGLRRLRSCRAHCEPEFRAWLRVTAIHLTLNCLRHQWRARRREQSALRKVAPPDRSGPDEGAIHARLEECRRVMAPKDFERLLVLMGLSELERPTPARTASDWTEKLLRNYPDLFRGSG